MSYAKRADERELSCLTARMQWKQNLEEPTLSYEQAISVATAFHFKLPKCPEPVPSLDKKPVEEI